MANDKATEKLATAMAKLADTLDRFQDPVLWQKVLADAIGSGLIHPPVLAPPQAQAISAPVLFIEGATVSLSDDERKRLSGEIYEAVRPQLEEFNQFVKASLDEMPPHRLKDLADRLKGGEKVQLKRRRGCVFIATESGNEFYLGL